MDKSVYDHAFYDEQSGGSYSSARRIIPNILEYLEISSVLDVGCGIGTFIKAFEEFGINDGVGVDGKYVPIENLFIDHEKFIAHDLETPLNLKRKFDLVLSLEVAEHLPMEKADCLIDSLCQHGDLVLFSAAAPFQGGVNHINEQWPSYWEQKFNMRGFITFDILRPRIWNDEAIKWWYRQNCLIFANESGIRKHPVLSDASSRDSLGSSLNIVHPNMFLNWVVEAEAGKRMRKVIEKICTEGGSYSFSKTDNGDIVIKRSN